MSEFINLGLKDYSFPYSVENIPEVLTGDSWKEKFMNAQNYVLTQASQLENGPEGRHAHTKRGEDLFYFYKHLGSGGYGSVDRVWSRLSSNEYARKQSMRKKNPPEDQIILRNFDHEISSLKRLSHQHLVSYVGSYTDQSTVAYLIEPVADCNLETYLCQWRNFIEARLPSLRSYFGCLSSAVSYLHRQIIWHRDLKPQNILVNGYGVFITDFGTALDWSKTGKDTTMTINAPFTNQYMAPEVAKRALRNSASDMWSLGIVFLDMTTVLRGRTLKDMRRFFQEYGSRHECIWANTEAAHGWFDQLQQAGSGPESDNEPLTWIKDLTQSVPSSRPLAWALINQIEDTLSVANFIGHCCITDDEGEYYPSPPSSSHWEEVEEFCPTEVPELQEKPLDSLIEPSWQNSIGKWLDLDPDIYPNDLTEIPSVVGGNLGETLDETAEDTTTQYILQSSSPEASVSNDHITIEQCEGYDIVEDTSDDEKTIDTQDQEYEIMEDSSGCGVTAKNLSSTSISRLGVMEDNDTMLVDASNDTQSYFSKAFQALREHLDALPEDSFEGRPLTTPSPACLPAPAVNPLTVANSTMSSSTENQNTTKNIDFDGPATASLDQSAEIKHTEGSSSRNEKPTKSVKFGSVESANVSPPTAITDSHVLPTLNDGNPTKLTKPNSLNANVVDDPTTMEGSNLLSYENQNPAESAKPDSSKITHVDPSTTTKVPVDPSSTMKVSAGTSAGGQEQMIGSQPGSLNATNLAVLSELVKRDSTTTESGVVWQDKHLNFLEQHAKAGKASVVRLLLSQGCSPGTKEKVRKRPLYWAIKGGSQRHNKCVAALLEAGADVNVTFFGGKTALHLAIEHEDFHGYTTLIRNLLEAGADPNVKDMNGDFPLLKILYGGYGPLEKYKRDALACLLHFDTNVNIMPPGTLNMPLHLAVRRKDPWAVSMLLAKGASVNQPNGSGLTPLMLAANGWTNKATHDQTEVLKIRLTNKANVNEQSGEHKSSALHLAISCGYEEGVLLLLQAEADPKIRDFKGRTPFHYAGDASNITKMGPETHGRIMSLLFESAGFDTVPAIEGQCAVVTTVLEGMTKEAKILLDRWALPNHLYKSIERTPLLHVALRARNLAMVRLLVDAKDEAGMDAFETCAAVGGAFAKSSFKYMVRQGKWQDVDDGEDKSGTDTS
ncbi:hypothetical protein JMJ35_000668 [Cladonia borealis]|uniref:Protein kinase domain-containing protein n=1 Tax=Cladonia borealis TaxID=184061 RepID=A0AA39V5R0_9LECA|nr:hypothetical protein JMJ35_000668 [Cladonia borealis]